MGYREDLLPWYGQPQEVVELQQSPLLVGLAFAWSGAALREMVRDEIPGIAAVELVPGPHGLVAACATGRRNIEWQRQFITTSDGVGTGDFTLLVVANPSAGSTVGHMLAQKNDAGGAPFAQTALLANSDAAAVASSGSVAFFTYATIDSGVAAAGLADGEYHVFVGRRQSTNHSIWRDGTQAATTSLAVRTISQADRWMAVGSRGNGTAEAFGQQILLALGWNRALSDEEISRWRSPDHLAQEIAPQRLRVPVGFAAAPSLTVADASHAHSADSLTLTTSSTLAIQDATHAHTADALSLTTQSALTVADATHAHAVDNVVLADTGSASLSIADALHSHTAGGLTLTTESALAIADALHAHAADGLTLSTGTSLLIAEALHAHTADGLDLTVDAYLVVADSAHGHTVDALVLTLPGTGADPAAVWSYVLSNGKTAEQNLVENNAMLAIVTAILRNKRITDPVAGTQTIFADDGISVLLQGGLFEDAAGTQPYRGQGADRAERLT